MISVLTSLFAFAAFASPLARRLRGASTWLLALPFIASFAWLASQVGGVVGGELPRASLGTIPTLGIDLALRLDGLGLLFGLLVTSIGAAVVVHAAGYLAKYPAVLGRFVAFASLFGAAMLGLVVADDLLVLFVCWELTSICSFLLVGLKHEGEDARSGAWRALFVTGAGGIALLVGILLLAQAGGTTRISDLVEQGEQIRESALFLPALLLILVGAFTKSAQVPFHYWLPGAMAAPSPVSAFLHSATLVKAGVFLLLRLHPILGPTEAWHVILVHAGLATMVVGAALAFAQSDLKRLLAYTTVAGLGTLMMLIGIGTEAALTAALLFVAVHALYKASLFMVVGYLDQRTGTRLTSELAGLVRREPWAFAAATLAGLSMMGLPPLLGAIAKELVHEAKIGAPEAPFLATAGGALANALVAGAALSVVIRPFLGRGEAPVVREVKRAALLVGPVVLAFAGLLLGAMHDTVAAPLVQSALAVLEGGIETPEFRAATERGDFEWLGKLTLVVGALLYVFRSRVHATTRWLRGVAAHGPTWLHDRGLAALYAVAGGVARVSDRAAGTPSFLVALALLIVAVLPVFLALGLPEIPAERWDLEAHEALVLLMASAGALATLRASSPPAAVAALGVTGFSVAMLFLLLGGPDLALTQVAVETLAVLLLLAALRGRRLPSIRETAPRRILYAVASLAVGGVFTLLALGATPDGELPATAAAMTAASVPEAFGRNVVNVILVDFRALDTMGEIFVLAIAALGVVALVRPTRSGKDDAVVRPTVPGTDSPVLAAAARTLVPLLVLLSLVLFVRGHHEPGGGFVGGLVAASAALVHGFAFGLPATRRRFSPPRLIVVGLALALLAGLIGLVTDGSFMSGVWLGFPVPAIGKLGTPLLFDAGVMLVVLGVACRVLFALIECEAWVLGRPSDEEAAS